MVLIYLLRRIWKDAGFSETSGVNDWRMIQRLCMSFAQNVMKYFHSKKTKCIFI